MEHGRERRGVGVWGRVRGAGAPELLFPDVAPLENPRSVGLLLPTPLFICSKIVADPNRIKTLCLKHTSWHRTVSF